MDIRADGERPRGVLDEILNNRVQEPAIPSPEMEAFQREIDEVTDIMLDERYCGVEIEYNFDTGAWSSPNDEVILPTERDTFTEVSSDEFLQIG